MKVLLKQDVDTLGFTGEIFEVAPGYGRNYLIPQGLAVPATDTAVKQAQVWIQQAAARREQLRHQYAALVERINGTTLTFARKAGETGKLYGSVTTADVAEALAETLKIEVDRRKVDGTAVRQVGNHTFTFRLDSEFTATIKAVVVAEGDAPAPAVVKAEAEPEAELEVEA
jgi:large subunit ribosomal protein L9